MAGNEPFSRRLREARLRKSAQLKEAGLPAMTQERLGIEAGIEEASASARINQYEQGVHLPDLQMARRFAEVLEVPMAYLFCIEDDLAESILAMSALSPARQVQVKGYIADLSRESES